jgi:hypothetical protein
MTVRSLFTGAALAAAVLVTAAPGFALEREENVYAELAPGQAPAVTVWDLVQGRHKPAMERQEARATQGLPTRTDATAGSSLPAATANPHMYDYLSGPEYQGGA